MKFTGALLILTVFVFTSIIVGMPINDNTRTEQYMQCYEEAVQDSIDCYAKVKLTGEQKNKTEPEAGEEEEIEEPIPYVTAIQCKEQENNRKKECKIKHLINKD